MNTATLLRRLIMAMLLGVVLYAGFVLFRGFRSIYEELVVFRWRAFGAALLLAFSNYFLRFLKWEYYLARLGIRGVPKFHSFLVFLSGFVLTVTPGKVGEVFKSLVLCETQGVPVSRTAPIVIAERLTDVIGVVVLVLIGSAGFQGGLLWAGAGALAVIIGLVVIASRILSETLFKLMYRMPQRIRAHVPRVRESWEHLRQVTSPGALLLPTLLSVGAWALEGVSLWVILWGLHAPTDMLFALFVYTTSTLAGALIPVPGGLGVTEGSLEQQLTRLGGVPLPAATSAMILVRVATLWFAVLLGFVALGLLRIRYPKLLSVSAPFPSPPAPLPQGERGVS